MNHVCGFLPLRLFAAAAFVIVASSGSTWADEPTDSRLVVHEWGVLGVGNANGAPIIGATDRFLQSLPDFVLLNEKIAPGNFEEQAIPLIIDKPVIHLYGKEGQKVEVTVRVAKGFPLVYFPKPELAFETNNVMNGDGKHGVMTQAQTMAWKFGLSKKRPASLLTPPDGHWWNAARSIPSDYVIMDDLSPGERFLFYEGTTYENPHITASVSKESVVVSNAHSEKSAPVILIVNDHGSHSGFYLDSIAPTAKSTISRDALKPWDEETLFAHCRKQWEACGMTPEEAEGIVESWRPELLETPGFLLISRIPRTVYDKIFPIKIKPTPAELKRACLVFDTLARQHQRKHWIPKLGKIARETLAELSQADFKRRLRAEATLKQWGEIMIPFVEEVLADESTDIQLRMATSTLMRDLAESPVCFRPLPHPSHIQGWGRGIKPIPDVIELEIPPAVAPPDIDG